MIYSVKIQGKWSNKRHQQTSSRAIVPTVKHREDVLIFRFDALKYRISTSGPKKISCFHSRPGDMCLNTTSMLNSKDESCSTRLQPKRQPILQAAFDIFSSWHIRAEHTWEPDITC